MLWLIELPTVMLMLMLMLMLVPERASRGLERINMWFTQHGRLLACSHAPQQVCIWPPRDSLA